MKDVVWFKDVDKDDVNLVGGKGANIGELYNLGIPIPNGFIVTSSVYLESLKKSGALDRIRAALFDLQVDDPNLLQTRAHICQKEIRNIVIDKRIEDKIYKYYKNLSGSSDAYVAVRSSATAEDLPDASFAGQQATFLNVRGKGKLKEKILEAWASLFEARAIFYRAQKKFDHFKVGIAVPIQKMVQAEASGVMFTVDPVTNKKDKIVIEAIFGLGELIVGGQVTPDHYEVNRKDFSISDKTIVSQEKQLIRVRGVNKLVSISRPYRQVQKLDDQKIVELAKIGAQVEKHYFFPQDLEWALAKNSLFIVQTRPVTTYTKTQKSKTPQEEGKDPKTQVLLQGSPASPVIGTGKVVIIKNPKELSKLKKGDVLVAEMTNPDYVPGMKKAVGIITDKGGRTSHAAIVSRELGIPCIVGLENITHLVKDGDILEVDANIGRVRIIR